jgi:hypothetical protein
VQHRGWDEKEEGERTKGRQEQRGVRLSEELELEMERSPGGNFLALAYVVACEADFGERKFVNFGDSQQCLNWPGN